MNRKTDNKRGTKHNNPKNKKKSRYAWVKYVFQILLVAVYLFGFYYLFIDSFNFKWKGIYGDKKYPDISDIHGIDISHFQGTIDWKKLGKGRINNNPISFVFMKATQGVGYVDKNFKKNFKNAREYGFLRGAYHYWSNNTAPKDQARFFIKTARLEKGDLAPVLDVEDFPKYMETEAFQRKVLVWLNEVEDEYDIAPIIYTGYKFKTKYLNSPEFDRYPFWIAHYYVKEIAYKGEWKFWQYTDAGSLPGIKGMVDFDVYNGSFYDLKRLTIGYEKD